MERWIIPENLQSLLTTVSRRSRKRNNFSVPPLGRSYPAPRNGGTRTLARARTPPRDRLQPEIDVRPRPAEDVDPSAGPPAARGKDIVKKLRSLALAGALAGAALPAFAENPYGAVVLGPDLRRRALVGLRLERAWIR